MMRIDEVMFGDWVYLAVEGQEKTPIQLLTTSQVAMTQFYEPIPITQEFLLANGWHWDRRDGYVRFENYDDLYFVVLHMDDKGNFFTDTSYSVGIKYIHQLQQLIRAFGHVKEANSLCTLKMCRPQLFEPGAKVVYYPVLDDKSNLIHTTVVSEPWDLCGTLVCRIEHRSCPVAVSHLEIEIDGTD